MRRLLPLAAILVVSLTACGDPVADEIRSPGSVAPSVSPALFGTGTVTIETDGPTVVLDVEVASTNRARQRGLMGRTELADDAGMVFLFESEEPREFWMKDTLIPLSIAYFDASGRIVSILDMEPCRADPCPRYPSGAPASGALEVNRGFFEDHGVRVGDRISVDAS